MKKRILSVILAVLMLVLAACGGGSDDTDSSSSGSESKSQTSAESSSGGNFADKSEASKSKGDSSEEPEKELNLDWDQLYSDFKEDPSVNDSFVDDVYVTLGDNGYIIISATLMDATDPEVALDYADTLLRRLNGVAQYQDSTIKSGNTEIYGGIYDVYGVQIGIAPKSKASDTNQWFVFDVIAPGVQCKHEIQLQKAYR